MQYHLVDIDKECSLNNFTKTNLLFSRSVATATMRHNTSSQGISSLAKTNTMRFAFSYRLRSLMYFLVIVALSHSFCPCSYYLGFLSTRITESPLRNSLLMNRSLLTGLAPFFPRPVLGTCRITALSGYRVAELTEYISDGSCALFQ